MANIKIKNCEEHNITCECKRCGQKFTFIGLTGQKADYCPDCLQVLYEEYLDKGYDELYGQVASDDCLNTPIV